MIDERSRLFSSLVTKTLTLAARFSLKKDQLAEDQNERICFFEIENAMEEMRILIYQIKEMQNLDEKKPVIEI